MTRRGRHRAGPTTACVVAATITMVTVMWLTGWLVGTLGSP